MKLYQLLERKKNRKFSLMYHGTSDKFLKSILKHGLLAQPPQRVYAGNQREKNHYNFFSNDLKTMGDGVYLTPFLKNAKDMADNAVMTFGGVPIVVTIKMTLGSSNIDEDELMPIIIGEFFNVARSVNQRKKYNSNVNKNKINKELSNSLKDNIEAKIGKISVETVKKINLLSDILINEYILTDNNSIFDSYYMFNQIKNHTGIIEILHFIMENIRRNTYTNAYVTRNIGFKGNTKIVSITHAIDDDLLYKNPQYRRFEQPWFKKYY